MEKTIKYPIEAFALALVLLSSQMKEAMIVGIALVFGCVLQHVFKEFFKDKTALVFNVIASLITCLTIYGLELFVGISVEIKQIITIVVLGVLLSKHQYEVQEEADYNQILLQNAFAYGFYVLFALLKQYMSAATVFETTLPELGFMSATYAKPMFSLVFAAIYIALMNKIFKTKSTSLSSLWVCLPIICIEAPFIMDNAPEWLGMIIGVVFVGIVYLTLRKKLVFSSTSKSIEGLPVELMMLSFIYMAVSIL